MGKIKDAFVKAKTMATGNEPAKVVVDKKLQKLDSVGKSLPTDATTKKAVKRGKKYTEDNAKLNGVQESRGGTFRVTKGGKTYTFKSKKEAQAFKGGK